MGQQALGGGKGQVVEQEHRHRRIAGSGRQLLWIGQVVHAELQGYALRQLLSDDVALAPSSSHEGQLRLMERRVKEWRTARAERLLESMRPAGKGTQTVETTNPVATPFEGNT